MRTILNKTIVAILAFFMCFTACFTISTSFAAADEGATAEGFTYSAVDCLRSGAEGNGWSVATFNGTAIESITTAAEANYTYFTTWQHSGYSYTSGMATAFVPNKNTYTKPSDVNSPDDGMMHNEKYSVVLVNDAETKLALVYTADKSGTVYYQDLAQVAPLHYDQRDSAGVYGEYRIVKIAVDGTATQVYPESGVHELYAANAAPTTSAYVNSSVDMAAGDKLAFISEKAESTIYSSPVVSSEEFEEVYELKSFWKWQQINDANFFEVVWRGLPTDEWQMFPNLETKHPNFDIYQRSSGDKSAVANVLYWGAPYTYLQAFGGMWLHASGNPAVSAGGTAEGEIAYAFYVPRNGYVNIDLEVLGMFTTDVEIWLNDTMLTASGAEHRAAFFHNGVTLSVGKPVAVKSGDVLYFVQKTTNEGYLKQDINPIISYVDEPYTVDKNEITLNEGDTDTLSLEISEIYGINASDVAWTSSVDGVVELTADGAAVTVKGVKAGQTVISATVEGYAPVTCAVTVKAVDKFSVSKTEATVEEGTSDVITVTITADGFSADNISVAAEDSDIVDVAINGTEITVIGKKAGVSEVYVTAEGAKSVTINVTVTKKQAPVISGDSTSSSAKGGCGMSLGGSIAGLAIMLAAAACLRKKN